MISAAHIKEIRLLHQKKYRNERHLFIAEGTKVVDELLKSSFVINEILALPQWIEQNREHIPKTLTPQIVSPRELARISSLSTPNMVLAVVEKPAITLPDFKKFTGFLLMLDGISDPGNLGTILRTADWFGIGTVLCSEDCVDVFNPKVVQAAMGSVFRVKTYYAGLSGIIASVQDVMPVYGTFLSGDNLYQTKFGNKGIIVIGSESHGISTGIETLVSKRVRIPSITSGTDSLNAAVACALVCAEINRNDLINI